MTVSAFKALSPEPGKLVNNKVQVKSFKDVNARGKFLCKQNDNSWHSADVEGMKSGVYKLDTVCGLDGKPKKMFIKVN